MLYIILVFFHLLEKTICNFFISCFLSSWNKPKCLKCKLFQPFSSDRYAFEVAYRCFMYNCPFFLSWIFLKGLLFHFLFFARGNRWKKIVVSFLFFTIVFYPFSDFIRLFFFDALVFVSFFWLCSRELWRNLSSIFSMWAATIGFDDDWTLYGSGDCRGVE